ncbi:AI-2E family transporter [Haloferax sp. MBLA0076]|uniref:AI-2E family transporter n=1 Tax=Haloferax litoreum TaxID=2666140 RepID=A0A6A8GLA1_9EURY|nr:MULTISPECIES: AI-2E family transporter [Haloferax]KAB1190582.1 AI-2E family transporter [Haloferax sp. CBA1148]MRX23571.1 AI-2E family transporter [Haloferax litoreum]
MNRASGAADRIRRVFGQLEVGWWIFALVVGAVIAFVGWVYLPWVVFGLFIYYVARPIQRRLERRLPSKNISAVVTLLLVVVPIVAILGGAILVTIAELSSFFTDEVVVRINAVLPLAIDALPQDPTELVRGLGEVVSGGAIQDVFGSVSRTVGSVASALFNAFLSLLFAFFLLREDDRLASWFHRNIADDDSDLVQYLRAVDEGLESVYFGYTITIFVVIVLAAIVYTLFNFVAPSGLEIPAPVTLAVVTGLFTIVPLVGRSIVYAVVTAYLALVALQTNPSALWFPLAFLAVMELPFDNLIRIYIRPALSGRLFPMGLIVFAYLVGPPLFGWYGIFYGPFLMVVVVLFLQLKFPRMLHPTADDGPLRRVGVSEDLRLDEDQTRLDEVRADIDEPAGASD